MALKFKDFYKGIRLKGVSSDPSDNLNGSIWYNSVANRLKAYINGAIKVLVSETDAQTLTNKTIVVSDNTVTTAASGNLTATELNAALAELQLDIDSRQPSDPELDAIAALATDGIIVKTGAGTAATRTIVGTSDQVSVSDGDGIAANPSIGLAANPIIPGTSSITIPIGTTAERPGSPVNGQLRYNTDLSIFEGYQAGVWGPIGGGSGADLVQEVPSGTVDGVNDTFALANTPSSADALLVFVDGVQRNSTTYSLSGSNIIFNAGEIPATGQSVYAFYNKASASPPSGREYKVEYRSLTLGEATAKSLTLVQIPFTSSQVQLDIIGGGPQFYGDDFTVSGSSLSWNTLALDGVLEVGDKLRIVYLY